MRFCWDFAYNQPRHFPAGTYRAQTATEMGRLELERMHLIGRVWRAYVGSPDMADWAADGDELAIHKWLNEQPAKTWQSVHKLLEMIWH